MEWGGGTSEHMPQVSQKCNYSMHAEVSNLVGGSKSMLETIVINTQIWSLHADFRAVTARI